eukprot:CAMPEP_0174370172 /NCGR_PEP_ID=MMETSP0811_2-20130205/95214_1 /TAXON_ID=73025 ORGANISM="Eutreptiella gymnastica-like, Strain CCMP1594" /NCGR_SAMPLE_ID=MMETSP0811_2 /ASSEMBLY_ACC=CAM_ASM_000667 /LENGTH=123 /DNA_ID=CAMNT_0015515327 /DNA_START=235 /DNA_END=602 /DNA_ORIENTATION=+
MNSPVSQKSDAYLGAWYFMDACKNPGGPHMRLLVGSKNTLPDQVFQNPKNPTNRQTESAKYRNPTIRQNNWSSLAVEIGRGVCPVLTHQHSVARGGGPQKVRYVPATMLHGAVWAATPTPPPP